MESCICAIKDNPRLLFYLTHLQEILHIAVGKKTAYISTITNCCVQSKTQLQMVRLIFFYLALHLTFLCSAQTKWKTINHTNGYHLQLPTYFKQGLLVASGTLQHYDNTLDSTIVVTVETFGRGTKEALHQEYKDELQRGNVTYSVLKPNWFVVSGTDGEGVFYLKTIISKGMMHHLRISYPPDNKSEADKSLAKIAASFY